jgi:hypothetical protein
MAYQRIKSGDETLRQRFHGLFKENQTPLRSRRSEHGEDGEYGSFRHTQEIAAQLEKRENPEYNAYLKSIRVVGRTRAQYAIRYPDGRTVLAASGEHLYFSNPDIVSRVQRKLTSEFKVQTVVVYGPAAKDGTPGDRVPLSQLQRTVR